MGIPVLTIIDKFNWIDRGFWLLAALRNVGHGGLREIRVSRYGELSGVDCARMLKRRGVSVHGQRVTSDHFIFSVRRQQAAWAEYILMRAHAGMDGQMVEQRNVGWAAKHKGLPPAWAEKVAGVLLGANSGSSGRK